jgi:hypothetical protein
MADAGEERRWDILVCDHCGQNADDNWRCRQGLCDRTPDEKPVKPSEALVEVMPVSEHEVALAKARKEIEQLKAGLRRIAETDWTQPPGDMPDEMARAALDSLTKEES